MGDTNWLGTSYAPPEDLPAELWERIGYTREQFLKEYEADVRARALRDKAAPRPGEPAPDFELERLDGQGRRSGVRLRLSSRRGRPVALVFGSYT